MNEQRILLMIAYKFPPMQSVSCNRTWALAREFKRYFREVYVLTTTNRHILAQDPRDLSGLHVIDVQTIDYRTLLQRKGKTSVVAENTKVSRIGKFAARVQSSFPTLKIFGEGGFLYVRNGVHKAEQLIATHPITHVFSTFSPYADHLVAYRIKQKHPQLKWIADFRDLHVDPAQDNLFRPAFQRKMNEQILRSADIVTTVSEGLAEHLQEIHSRVVVLRNGIAKPGATSEKLFTHFTLAYTGSMFQDKRNPEPVLQALRELKNRNALPSGFRILHAGKDAAVWKQYISRFGLDAVFEDLGFVSRQEANEVQQRSHLNLLLTYSTPGLKGNLTGKLADYLSAGRPIIALINGPRDREIEAFMRKTQAGYVFYAEDISGITEFLEKQFALYHQGEEVWITQENLGGLAWPAIMDTFMAQNFQFTQMQESETA